MKLELVSFKLCPYVQRAVMTLRHKDVPFELRFIDLDAPPDWFLRLSPFGKVPVLTVNGETVLFESAVITEFIDEATGEPHLLPEDPLERATTRSWIEFGSACLTDLNGIMTAGGAREYDDCAEALFTKLETLERRVDPRPWFNGEAVSLADFTYAPLFQRITLMNLAPDLIPPAHFPRLHAWSETLLAQPLLRESVVSDFERLLAEHIHAKSPFTASRLGIDPPPRA